VNLVLDIAVNKKAVLPQGDRSMLQQPNLPLTFPNICIHLWWTCLLTEANAANSDQANGNFSTLFHRIL